ncbi:DDE-type integrase/transposase/recombinase [Tepidibacter sp. Z1-5]|uniref:DDE-type integrase/transposase/recombinase n=1 Tax=Tepidibacter sp. Z1-5 TaxID=3134138 RepID=UPI00404079E0
MQAAKRFFIKALKSPHNQNPRVVTADKSPSYPKPINELKNNIDLNINTKFSQIKYLNNIVEQDHRFIKKSLNRG